MQQCEPLSSLTSLIWMRNRFDSTSGSMIPPLDFCLSQSFWSSNHFCWKSEPIAALSNYQRSTVHKNKWLLLLYYYDYWLEKAKSISSCSTTTSKLPWQRTSGCWGTGDNRSWSRLYLRGSLHTGQTTVSSYQRESKWGYRVSLSKLNKSAVDIWPDTQSCLWSCPPPAPSSSGGAPSQSDRRSGQDNGSGSSGSSLSL